MLNAHVADAIEDLPESAAADVFCQYWTVMEALVKYRDTSIFRERSKLVLRHPKPFVEYQERVQDTIRLSRSIARRARIGVVYGAHRELTVNTCHWIQGQRRLDQQETITF